MSDIDNIIGACFSGLFRKNITPEESVIAKSFKTALDARSEVNTPVGIVDLVSDKFMLIAEVKAVRKWKHAIGQVLIYQQYFKDKTPYIILFGDVDESYMDLVKSHSKALGVEVMFVSGLSKDEKDKARNRMQLKIRLHERIKELQEESQVSISFDGDKDE